MSIQCFTGIAIVQKRSAYMDIEGQISLILLQPIDLPEEGKPLLLSPKFTALYRNKEALFDAFNCLPSPPETGEIEAALRDKGFSSFTIYFQGDTASDQNVIASRLLGHAAEIGPGYAVPNKTFAVQLSRKNKE